VTFSTMLFLSGGALPEARRGRARQGQP